MSKELLENYERLNKIYAILMVIFFLSLIVGIFLVTYSSDIVGNISIGVSSISIISLFFLGIKRRKIRTLARQQNNN